MSKLFSTILFSFFLILQTTAHAEEEITQDDTQIEAQEMQVSEALEETEATEENNEQEVQVEATEEIEPEEELSEAEKEALAAEEAELRELGMEEEPVAE